MRQTRDSSMHDTLAFPKHDTLAFPKHDALASPKHGTLAFPMHDILASTMRRSLVSPATDTDRMEFASKPAAAPPRNDATSAL